MNRKPKAHKAPVSSPSKLGNHLLGEWTRSKFARTPMAPGLIIGNASVPLPDREILAGAVKEPLLHIETASPEKCSESEACLHWGEIPVVRTSASLLPIQSSELGLVLLWHVLSDGGGRQLEEACRALEPGGVLLVAGLNRNSFRYAFEGAGRGIPGLRPLAVREKIDRLGMNMETLLAAGFFGRSGPRNMNTGFARILIPVADMLMIVARKKEPRLATPIKRSQLRTVSAPAALGGP